MKALTALSVVMALGIAAEAAPVRLRCEYLENPIGIDAATPHLSWQSDNAERDWRQTAYQILVASTPALLTGGKPDIWDSGKQSSVESVGIVYGGPRVEARRRYYWTVRVWDARGQASPWAQPAYWEMGLLAPQDWKAKWITWSDPEEPADRAVMRWIWLPGQDASAVAPKTVGVFRTTVNLAARPQRAAIILYARGDFQLSVNGRVVARKNEWHAFDWQEIGDRLAAGRNTIEVKATVTPAPEYGPDAGPPDSPRPAGVVALVKMVNADGSIERVPTDEHWEARAANDSGWQAADVIGDLRDPHAEPGPLPKPAALLRREFPLDQQVRSARLYVSALGSYRVFLNGQRVGHDVLTPDFTDYNKRVLYQTYDVTGLLSAGVNVIGAILGDGWYASPLTWTGQHFFPAPTRFCAQLEIQFADGRRETVASDEAWEAAASPILHSSIYSGEVYDARLEQAGWGMRGFHGGWAPAVVADPPSGLVTAQMSRPVEIIDAIKPQAVTSPSPGAYVFDMGQNMVGWVRLRAHGPAGAMVRMRFAEILNKDGTIYTENLRNADATDVYILRGGGEEFAPHFTFHGFRYVEVSGYPGKPTLDDVTGEVTSSVTWQPSGKLETASALVNRMYGIGLWGQRGNFLSIPTDCPQRDERLGWTGDAGVFWRTGTYNFDVAAFSRKWMRDMTDDQTAEGAFPNVAPDMLPGMPGAPGWGDAGVIVPWTAWMQYGDTGIVEQSWNGMEKWMSYIAGGNPDFLRRERVGPNFGDWLAPGSETPKDLIATAYWAMMADRMSQMAGALGREQDAERYSDLFNKIRTAFQGAWVKPDGTIGSGSQTSYVLALWMKLVPASLVKAAVDNLVKDIEAHQWHLTTGFLGTPHLLFVLAENGRTDVAYRLLLNETYPSWGYMLSKGATTWWERWNGDTGDPAMNSFNHYAFGSVMEWVYRRVAGIDAPPNGAGFHRIWIRPLPDVRLTHARGEYNSVYGRIVSDWTSTPQGAFTIHVTIPANTTATVFLPAAAGAAVTEGGKPLHAAREGANYVVAIGSGTYDFVVK